LHNRKTAGSSIAAILSKELGANDLMIGCWNDALNLTDTKLNRRAIKDIFNRKGFYSGVKLILTHRMNKNNPILNSHINILIKKKYDELLCQNSTHATAKVVKENFPYEWENYFIFCTVRNPYERAVSDYRWRVKNGEISFINFLERIYIESTNDAEGYVPIPNTNWPIYTIDDNIEVDYVVRYENFKSDIEFIFKKYNFKHLYGEIPHAKKFKSYDYKQYYTAEAKKLVENIYQKEIEAFNYEF